MAVRSVQERKASRDLQDFSSKRSFGIRRRDDCVRNSLLHIFLRVISVCNDEDAACRPEPGFSFAFSGCGFLTCYHVGVADALIRSAIATQNPVDGHIFVTHAKMDSYGIA